MKPSLVADEMFPEGAGPYMDIEEVNKDSVICMMLMLFLEILSVS